MKIAFLCGSLEPGKDGVGDYTRLLAKEVSVHGHPVMVISICDKTASEAIIEEVNADANFSIIRSFALFHKNQFARIKKIIANFQPHIISLQYVPYSFSSFGTPLFLGRRLKSIFFPALWHVMIHEPFLSKENSSFKNRIIRQLQISSLHLLKYYLQPVVWNTSNPYYQQRIQKSIHVPCKILGLFSNIPLTSFQQGEQEKRVTNTFTAVYFGTVPQPKNHKIIADKLRNDLRESNMILKIIFCGKGGANEQAFHLAIQSALAISGQHTIVFAGVLPAEKLSHLFTAADFGIARVPPHLLGKSGAAIAMLEHGLPVWIPLAEVENYKEDIDFRPELCFANLQSIGAFTIKNKQPIARLPIIASTFLEHINKAVI